MPHTALWCQHTITTETAAAALGKDAYLPFIQLNAYDEAPKVTCAQLEAELAQARTVESVTVAQAREHEACQFRTRTPTKPDLLTRGVVAFVAKGQVLVNCIYKESDKVADDACNDVLSQMSVKIIVTVGKNAAAGGTAVPDLDCGDGRRREAERGRLRTVEVREASNEELGTCVANALRGAEFPATVNGGTFAQPYRF